jgi:hypothetical protein
MFRPHRYQIKTSCGWLNAGSDSKIGRLYTDPISPDSQVLIDGNAVYPHDSWRYTPKWLAYTPKKYNEVTMNDGTMYVVLYAEQVYTDYDGDEVDVLIVFKAYAHGSTIKDFVTYESWPTFIDDVGHENIKTIV